MTMGSGVDQVRLGALPGCLAWPECGPRMNLSCVCLLTPLTKNYGLRPGRVLLYAFVHRTKIAPRPKLPVSVAIFPGDLP